MRLQSDLSFLLFQNAVFCFVLGLPAMRRSLTDRGGLIMLGICSLVMTTVVTGMSGVYRMLLPDQYAALLMPVCLAVTAAVLDLLILLICTAASGVLGRWIAPILHSAALSGAVIGSALISGTQTYDIPSAFRFGFRSGISFLLVCILLRTAQPAWNSQKMPAAVRGWRGMLLLTALMTMSAACMAAGMES